MSTPATDKLVFAAARLARIAPVDWEQFIGAFNEYSAEQTRNLLASAPDVLQVAQGRAQLCAHLKNTLDDCIRLADKKGK